MWRRASALVGTTPAARSARTMGSAEPSSGSGTSSAPTSTITLSMPSPSSEASTCSMVWISTSPLFKIVRRPWSAS